MTRSFFKRRRPPGTHLHKQNARFGPSPHQKFRVLSFWEELELDSVWQRSDFRLRCVHLFFGGLKGYEQQAASWWQLTNMFWECLHEAADRLVILQAVQPSRRSHANTAPIPEILTQGPGQAGTHER